MDHFNTPPCNPRNPWIRNPRYYLRCHFQFEIFKNLTQIPDFKHLSQIPLLEIPEDLYPASKHANYELTGPVGSAYRIRRFCLNEGVCSLTVKRELDF